MEISETQKITELLDGYLYEVEYCTDYSIIVLYKNKATKTVHVNYCDIQDYDILKNVILQEVAIKYIAKSSDYNVKTIGHMSEHQEYLL